MKIKDILLLCSTIGIATAAQTIDRRCLDCMCQASSNCNLKLRCHNAADGSYYCGPYQISWAYWADAGKPGSSGFSNDFEKCLVDQTCAERTIAGYMSKWASDCNGDGQIDCLDFAAIHKTGPTAQCNQSWLKNSKYWTDFNRCYGSSPPSSSSSSSSGFTGSSNFPGNNHHHEVIEVENDVPRLSGAYAISSSDPKPLSRSTPEIRLTASSSSTPLSPISTTTTTTFSSSSSYPSPSSPSSSSSSSSSGDLTSSHYSSSSSSFSNYTEITEESSSGNLDNYNPSRSPLPGRTVYETLSSPRTNQPNVRTRVVEEVVYQPSSVSAPEVSVSSPAPAPVRVDVRPVNNDYVERESPPEPVRSVPSTNYVYEQPASPVTTAHVQPQVQPIVPVNTASSFVPSAGPSVVPQSCLNCLCQASTKCEINKGCDGAYCGPFLLSWAYWTDGGKPGSAQGLDYPTCSRNHSCASQAVNGYMNKWTRDCNGDGVVDCTDYALIHKLGPHGCGRLEALKSTEYWNRFEACFAAPSSTPIEAELPAIQPVAPPTVTINVPETPAASIQPETSEVISPSRSYSPSQPARIVEPVGRRNDFHESPLNVPRPQPQPNAFFTSRSSSPSSNSGSTSNIRISFNNREIVNTAVQNTPIVHAPSPSQPQLQPTRSYNNFNNPAPAPSSPSFNSFNNQPPAPSTNSFNSYNNQPPAPSSNTFSSPGREYPPRPSSAFSSEVVSEAPRASDYVSNSNSGTTIREVPANNDNTGFDDSSFGGRSVDGNDYSDDSSNSGSSESAREALNFNPFSALNKTEDDLVSQDCLNCMCHAASRCDPNIGCTSDSRGKFVCGVFQVDWEYWSDAGKPGNRADLSNLENFQMCLNNRKCADETIRGYMKTHKMDCNGDGKIDCHDYAALHVVGPSNCKAKWYLDSKYHNDFNSCYNF